MIYKIEIYIRKSEINIYKIEIEFILKKSIIFKLYKY